MIAGLTRLLVSRMQLLTAVGLTFVALSAFVQSAPLAESPHSAIEYASPGAAFNASDAAKHVVWSFAPKDDPAYPTVVKRAVVERNGRISMDMSILCNASKSVCDDLVRKFVRLNEQVKLDVQNRSPERSSAPGR